MMVVVFLAMTAALIFGWIGRRDIAIACLAACFVLAVWLFLFEIYSPDYGFRMPWIRV